MGFALRAPGALDLDLMATLHRAAFAPMGERPWSRHEFADLLAAHGVAGIVLSFGDEAAGFALVRVTVDEAELLTLAVDARHRRRGAGRALLEAVVEYGRQAGARRLFLEVGVDNAPARSLYEAAGFTLVGRRASYYRRGAGAPADALVMQLALS